MGDHKVYNSIKIFNWLVPSPSKFSSMTCLRSKLCQNFLNRNENFLGSYLFIENWFRRKWTIPRIPKKLGRLCYSSLTDSEHGMLLVMVWLCNHKIAYFARILLCFCWKTIMTKLYHNFLDCLFLMKSIFDEKPRDQFSWEEKRKREWGDNFSLTHVKVWERHD